MKRKRPIYPISLIPHRWSVSAKKGLGSVGALGSGVTSNQPLHLDPLYALAQTGSILM